MTWYKSKTFYLFIILLVHVSLLDLFFIGDNGLVFLFTKNSEFKTIITHITIIGLSVLFYRLLVLSESYYRRTNAKISDMTWVLCSVFILCAIGLIVV